MNPDTQPQSVVTESDLRQLLQVGGPGSRLVLREGRIGLDSGAEDGTGGMPLITRGELIEHVGAEPELSELTAEAETVNTKIRMLGA
ncbi:hypothetical protein [Nocardia sp. BMG51109]|uniref:hypothetical protein n=1 Tax=Nocardia sp. BMG51109 TaxID=1056816 RepID=UPI0004670963|nr:hypothetical protein [Nocardia sp. BMG51109]